MQENQAQEKLEILKSLYKIDLMSPFPYEDCQKILMGNHEDFIPDLSVYFSTIAGYCSWGKRILKWSEEQFLEAQKLLQHSFFREYEKYLELKLLITEENTPKLYNQLLLHDLMRLTLLDVIAGIKTEKQLTFV